MTSERLNCWQDKRCGCEPGGAQAERRGVCPAAVDTTCNGINGGRNAGRFCWTVPETLCDGEVQGTFEEKIAGCHQCSFFRRVKYEEGGHLQVFKPGMGVTDPAELHRAVNSLVRLAGVSRDILACLAEEPLLQRIAEHARAITGSCSASAYVLDGTGRHLVLAAHAGAVRRPPRLRLDADCPVAEAARRRRLCSGSARLREEADPACVNAAPMCGHDKLPGVLELVKTAGRFSADDEWFLREFGLIAGLGIENARHVEDLRQLRRFDKAKSRFVALLMHHITSPLATIACSVQALAQLGERLSADDRRELIQNSLDRIGSVQEMSKRLLDLAAIRSGRSLGAVRAVRPGEVLRQQVEARQARARERGLDVVLTDTADEATVQADPDGLALIFGNLIGNAIKYSTDSARTVDVSLEAASHAVRITVRDRGIGIPPDEQAGVFEEFRRGSNVAAAHATGFGIGLAVVKELVERYHGRIELTSQVGQGTTISVEFPAWEG